MNRSLINDYRALTADELAEQRQQLREMLLQWHFAELEQLAEIAGALENVDGILTEAVLREAIVERHGAVGAVVLQADPRTQRTRVGWMPFGVDVSAGQATGEDWREEAVSLLLLLEAIRDAHGKADDDQAFRKLALGAIRQARVVAPATAHVFDEIFADGLEAGLHDMLDAPDEHGIKSLELADCGDVE